MNIKKIFNKYFILAILLTAPSVIWALLDKTPWPWDQADYGMVSVNLYHKIFRSFPDWYQGMMTAFSAKAPGIAWFGQLFVPFRIIFGTDTALLFLIITAEFLVLIMTFKIILSLTSDKKISAVGMLIMSSAPLFIGLSHQFLVEMLQLLAVVFFFYIFTVGKNWKRYNQIIALIIALSFSFLTKITTPIYVFIPGFFILINIFKAPSEKFRQYFLSDKRRIFIWLFGIIIAAGTIGWYSINGKTIIKFMVDNSIGSTVLLYRERVPFLSKLIVWLGEFLGGFFVPAVAIIFLVIVIYFVGSILLKKISFKKKEINLAALASFFSVFIILLLFSLQISNGSRFLFPLYIYVVVMVASLMYYLKNIFVINFIIVLFLSQFLYVNAFSLGLIKISKQNFDDSVVPPQRDASNKSMIKSAIRETCNSETKNKPIAIGVEYIWLSANTLNYYASQDGSSASYQCHYVSPGFAETDVEKSWVNMSSSMKPSYFIGVSPELYDKKPDVFNVISLPILEKVEESNLFTKVDTPNQPKIQIFKASYPDK